MYSFGVLLVHILYDQKEIEQKGLIPDHHGMLNDSLKKLQDSNSFVGLYKLARDCTMVRKERREKFRKTETFFESVEESLKVL